MARNTINFGVDLGIKDFFLKRQALKEQEREKRQDQILLYRKVWADQGVPIEDQNAMARLVAKTGFPGDYPTSTTETKFLPPEKVPGPVEQYTQGGSLPIRGETKPFELQQPFFDPTTGAITYAPRGTKAAQKYPEITENKVWNPDTQEYDVIKTKGRGKVIGKPEAPKTPKTLKDYQDDIASNVLKNYFTLQATGSDTTDILPSAIGAAKRFGMTIDKIPNDPTMMQRIFGGDPGMTEQPSFTPRKPGIPVPTKLSGNDLNSIVPNPTQEDIAWWNGLTPEQKQSALNAKR